MRFLCFEIKIKYAPKNIFLSKRRIRKLITKEWTETDNKIKAIKKHRELTNSSLKDAKNYCDNLQKTLNIKMIRYDN